MGQSNLSGPLLVGGVPTLGTPAWFPVGKAIYVDGANGSDGNPGTADRPYATLLQAYNAARSGKNDCIYVCGDGTSSGTARLSASLTWAKNACHLIGLCAPTEISGRSRVAATSTALYTPLMTITGQGCCFANLSFFHGYSTAADQTCVLLQGNRCYFGNVHFGGMGHATPAARANSRSLVIDGVAGSGWGEHTFERCTFGLDTIVRGAANAEVEFLNGSPRNVFRQCRWISFVTAAGGQGHLCVKIGAGGIDRWAEFDDCTFLNSLGAGGGLALTAALSLNAAAGGDAILRNCSAMGITDWHAGNPTNVWVDGGAPTAGTSGIALNYTA